MYLDKPIKEHNLLQAIARTNRTYAKKDYGLIVDYYGVSRFLEQALGIFTKSDIQGALKPIESEIPRLQSRHRAAMNYFNYINQSNAEACVQVLEPEDVRNEFETAFKRFSESMDMVMPNPKAQPYVENLKFLGKIRQLAKSRYREEGMDITECGEKVRQLIADHLYASSVEVLHDPIDILSNKFEQKIEKSESEEAKASEMEHALRHEIKIKMEENPVYYSSLKEKLEELISSRRANQMEIIDLVDSLREMVQDMRETTQKGEEHGFTREQFPFFQLLEQELAEEDKEEIKDLTFIVTGIVQSKLVIEWAKKDDVKREMRSEIKKKLRQKIDHPKLEAVAQQLMDLAAVHYKK